jgi:hypothetical protein
MRECRMRLLLAFPSFWGSNGPLTIGGKVPSGNRSAATVCFAVLAITVLAFVFLFSVRHSSSRPAHEAPTHQEN